MHISASINATDIQNFEAAALLSCCEASVLLSTFFDADTDKIDSYNHNNICLKCLTLTDPGTTEDCLKMVTKVCGGNVHVACTSLFNKQLQEITTELNEWKQQAVTAAQAAICDVVCEQLVDFELFPDATGPLIDWIAGWVTVPAITSILKHKYADQLASVHSSLHNEYVAAKAGLKSNYDTEVEVFNSACKSFASKTHSNL